MLSDFLAAVAAIAAPVDGLVTVLQGTAADELPWSSTPLLLIEVAGVNGTQITFGPNGQVEWQYDLLLHLVLGPADMQPDVATTTAQDLCQRLPMRLLSDDTFGGVVTSSTLLAGTTNLIGAAYRATGEPPMLTWQLTGLEYLAVSAGA